jgi:Cu-processing system permease protein
MMKFLSIAQLEFMSASRLKWVRLLTAIFALLGLAAAYSAGAAREMAGVDGFARTTLALVPAVLILVPLAAVVLGVSGQAVEAGSDPFLFAQPIGRVAILVARWLGELAALGVAIVVGFAAAALLVVTSSGAEGLASFGLFVAMAVVLAAIFLAIAAAIAASTDTRATALGLATFAWFFFVILYDGIALSLAGYLTGAVGGRVLFWSVFVNPSDLIRITMLLMSGTSNVLGASGEAWLRFLGGGARAAAAAGAAFALWIVAPLAAGAVRLNARDL